MPTSSSWPASGRGRRGHKDARSARLRGWTEEHRLCKYGAPAEGGTPFVGRGRARERSAFSPSGGNRVKRTLRGRSDSEESVFSVLLRDRDTPSAACGGSSLGEGAKDGAADLTACGLRMTGWDVVLLCVGRDDPARPRKHGAASIWRAACARPVCFCVSGLSSRRARRSGMGTGGRSHAPFFSSSAPPPSRAAKCSQMWSKSWVAAKER